jgi:hypothetical protein
LFFNVLWEPFKVISLVLEVCIWEWPVVLYKLLFEAFLVQALYMLLNSSRIPRLRELLHVGV